MKESSYRERLKQVERMLSMKKQERREHDRVAADENDKLAEENRRLKNDVERLQRDVERLREILRAIQDFLKKNIE